MSLPSLNARKELEQIFKTDLRIIFHTSLLQITYFFIQVNKMQCNNPAPAPHDSRFEHLEQVTTGEVSNVCYFVKFQHIKNITNCLHSLQQQNILQKVYLKQTRSCNTLTWSMICFCVQSIKLLKYQRELRGFVKTNVNKKNQYFALFNTMHHIFDKSLHLPLLGGEMYMLLRIDLGNKQYTVVWQQPGASGSFCLLRSRAT